MNALSSVSRASRRRLSCPGVGVALLAVGASTSSAADWAASAAADEQVQGLIQTLRSRDGRAEVVDRRRVRMPAVFVSEGDAASGLVSPGPFVSTWEGSLRVRLLDDYEFHFEGTGRVRWEIGGQEYASGELVEGGALDSEMVELDRGEHAVRLVYESPDSGDAKLTLRWSSFDFSREPLSPEQWRGPVTPPTSARAARGLFTSRRCAHCHEAGPLDGPHAMPELAHRAPSLEGLAGRLKPDWLARWILDPRALRPDAIMPVAVPEGEEGERAAADLVAHLMKGAAGVEAPVEGDVERGVRRFETLGCFACHDLEEAGEGALGRRIGLWHVGAKWRGRALVEFLRAPARHHPGIGMPDFALDETEARDLAAFLMSRSVEVEPVDLSAADASRGAVRLASLGCLGCHDGPGESATEPPPPLTALARGLDRGCLGEGAERGSAPRFAWTTAERDSLRQLLREAPRAAWVDTPADYATRVYRDSRCAACHQRDGEPSIWTQLRPEPVSEPWDEPEAVVEDVILQDRPVLTWSGGGLRPEWMAGLFRGDHPPTRPWLATRMPRFAVDAERLAQGLAAQHGAAPTSRPAGDADAALAEVGAVLVKQTEGLGCMQCHDRGAAKAAGVFDAQGPDFALIPARLRPDYFRFLLNDPRRALGSPKMPRFVEEGRTAIVEYYGGDALQQFDALWHYMLDLDRGSQSGGER